MSCTLIYAQNTKANIAAVKIVVEQIVCQRYS